MLGNFSIGDYFKDGAIEFAWELATSEDGFGFDPDKVWVTVFEGDAELGLGADEEAIAAWQRLGVSSERIVKLGRADNFWQAGPTGPCGPCSELYLDRGPEFGPDTERPGSDGERFLEFWNLVFMEFEQVEPGKLAPLPAKNIDTGLGLNRMAAIQQGVESVFDTDQFMPLIELGEQLSGKGYLDSPEVTRGLRILADHSRAACFLIADGVVPSNEDRGYILRRLMRRAIQQGRTLGMEQGFLVQYQAAVEATMGDAYPELLDLRPAITKWLDAEEESFGRTLEHGSGILEQAIAQAKDSGSGQIAADEAFKLHDTFGFPVELTIELASEAKLSVDTDGFERLMNQQRDRARAAGGSTSGAAGSERETAMQVANETDFTTEFVGYGQLEQETVLGAVAAAPEGGAILKLAESPFYAEGGGQVSDSGVITLIDGDRELTVDAVFRLGDDQALKVSLEGELPPAGVKVRAAVDPIARRATACNHTATHLLQAALREELGDHVRQAGSAVRPDKLRFDFSHHKALSLEELRQIEDLINDKIRENHPVNWYELRYDEVQKRDDIKQFFGEKYGTFVRVIDIDYSKELCGGTHTQAVGNIGLFRIVKEGSIAAGIRRIEAVTGKEAELLNRQNEDLLLRISQFIKSPIHQIEERLAKLVEENRHTAQELKDLRRNQLNILIDNLMSQTTHAEGFKFIVAETALPVEELRQCVDLISERLGSGVVLIGTALQDKCHLIAKVSDDCVKKGISSHELIKLAMPIVEGSGGGKPQTAQGGGKAPHKLLDALEKVKEHLAVQK
mgnify:CR=1 FL=1